MAFKYNGNTPKKITYNSQNVKTLKYNDVVVWTASTPFYWFQRLQGETEQYYVYDSQCPTEWTKTEVCCDDNANVDLRIEQPSVSCDNWDAHLRCVAEAPAKGNRYATIYVVDHAWNDTTLYMNGTKITSAGTHTVDVSATDKLSLDLITGSGLTINYIYFHS